MDSEIIKRLIEAYWHHIFFFIFFIVAGIIIQAIIQKIIYTLYPKPQRNTVRSPGGPAEFFLLTVKILSWTASLYLGCKIFYLKKIPDEFYNFLLVIIKTGSLIVSMLLLSYGINHILANIIKSSNSRTENKNYSAGDLKKSIALSVIYALAWAGAFIVATMYFNVIDYSSLFIFVFLAAVLIFAPVFLYRSSEAGHQLITGLIGYFYLRNEQKNMDTGQPFRLRIEDERIIEVIKISPFHTSFKTDDGTIEVRHNALLMHKNYGFKEFNSGSEKPE